MSKSEPLYGWVMVAIAFVYAALCFGGVATVAVFLKPLAAEFGWERSDVSMAYTIATISTAVAGVYFGRIADRHGVRKLAWLGILTIGLSMMALSWQSSLLHLYAGYAVFGAVGFAALSVPISASLTNWFTENRGLALGTATAGGALGQGLVPFFAGMLLPDVGWRGAYFYVGLAFLIIGLPLAALVRDPRPASAGAAAAAEAAERALLISPREAVTWISVAVVFCCICMSVPIIHAVALATDSGISPQRAAGVLAAMMISAAVGRIVTGRISDRIGELQTYMAFSVIQTITVIWFVTMQSFLGFVAIAVLFGFGFGGVMTSFLLTIRSLVPARVAATSMAIVVLFGWIGMGLGAYQGGLFFDWTTSYDTSFTNAGIAGVVNLLILTMLYLRLRRMRGGSPSAAGATA